VSSIAECSGGYLQEQRVIVDNDNWGGHAFPFCPFRVRPASVNRQRPDWSWLTVADYVTRGRRLGKDFLPHMRLALLTFFGAARCGARGSETAFICASSSARWCPSTMFLTL
jgi:hypothetical protein